MVNGPRCYTGVLHVHTDREGGDGTLEEVLSAARQNAVDFVILTDCAGQGYAPEEAEGWHDGVLVLCAEEVRAPDGHVIAFEMAQNVGPVPSLEEALGRIGERSGVAVSVHHHFSPRPDTAPPIAPPLGLAMAGIVEIWSFMDDFLCHTAPQSLVRDAGRAGKLLGGPPRRVLRAWDREQGRRPLPAVGGLNVRQRKQPLLEWRPFFPYAAAFQTVCTVIQCPELPANVPGRARDLVWNALRMGRSYVANRSVATEKGFRFEFKPATGRARQMGETAAWSRGGRFRIEVPEEAEVVLRHNSQPLFWGTAKEITFPPATPGTYRVEVYLNRQLWIMSNAIRLVDEDGSMMPTVSDVT